MSANAAAANWRKSIAATRQGLARFASQLRRESIRSQALSNWLVSLEVGAKLSEYQRERLETVIPNQSSVAKAWQEFDDAGRMKPSPFYDRVVDVMEELFKFTLMVRDRSDYLVDRYSERKGVAEAHALSVAAGVIDVAAAAPVMLEPANASCAKGTC